MARSWRARQSPAASGTLGKCGSARSSWSSPPLQVLASSTPAAVASHASESGEPAGLSFTLSRRGAMVSTFCGLV